MMRCPACRSILYRRTVARRTLHGCPGCGGAWLTPGDREVLARDPDAFRTIDATFPRGLQQAASAAAPRSCPTCDSVLRSVDSGIQGMRIKTCDRCQGAWLEHGEATALAGRIETPRPPLDSVAMRFAPIRTANVSGDPTRSHGLPLVRGIPIHSFDRSPGLLASIERGMRFVLAAYSMAIERPRLLVPLVAGGLLQLAIAGLGLLIGLAGGPASWLTNAEWLSHGAVALVPLAALLVFVAHLSNTAILGMTVSLVDAYLKGREPDVRIAARDVLRNARGVLAMAAVSALVSLATSRDGRGRRGLLASLIDTAWTVLAYLLMPVIMIEDVGLATALRRAKEIHGNGLVPIAVGEIGLRAIAGISGFLVLGLLALLGLVAVPLGVPGIVALVAVGLLILVALGVLNAFARGAYYTCLYLWTVEIERAGGLERALVPAPLASALQA